MQLRLIATNTPRDQTIDSPNPIEEQIPQQAPQEDNSDKESISIESMSGYSMSSQQTETESANEADNEDNVQTENRTFIIPGFGDALDPSWNPPDPPRLNSKVQFYNGIQKSLVTATIQHTAKSVCRRYPGWYNVLLDNEVETKGGKPLLRSFDFRNFKWRYVEENDQQEQLRVGTPRRNNELQLSNTKYSTNSSGTIDTMISSNIEELARSPTSLNNTEDVGKSTYYTSWSGIGYRLLFNPANSKPAKKSVHANTEA